MTPAETPAPRLKQLTLQGFKSFAEPTVLLFPGGITAIVGPNGSGKSNIADAVRWVLGEQRMSTLRGRSGEDMIFAGSKRRARVGMARVELLFDNRDHWLPLDFDEVAIERRVYRDGRSEYRLNGSRVRLSDLRDLLDRAGLGRDAYFTIGQGLVDRILSLRPGERLAIFEQAAGIAPYRRRREEAINRLEGTQRNLERVQDILAELEPRLHRLERQVKRLKEHAALEESLRERQRLWYGYRWGEALNALESARQKRSYLRGRVEKRMAEVEAVQQQIAELRHRLSRLRTELTQVHHESSARHRAAERAQRDLAVAQERRRLLAERLEEGRANLIPLESALAEQEEALESLAAQLQAAESALAEAQARWAEAQAAREAVEARRRALLAAQATAQARALEARHRLVNRQERLRQVEAQLARLEEERRGLEAEQSALDAQRRSAQAEVEQARRAVEAQTAEVERAQAALEALHRQEAAQREALETTRRRLASLEAELDALTTRLALLERMEAEGEGLYGGVRAVLRAMQRGELHGLRGTVASLFGVPPRIERAVETALGGQVQSLVAEDWEAAQAAIAYLKHTSAGWATFLPLDTLRPPRKLRLPAGMAGVLGVAADLVDYDPSLEAAARLLLGRVAIVEDLEAARKLHRRLQGSFQIVTLEGELLRSGGTLTGGRSRGRRSGGLLARQRELRHLPEQIAARQVETDRLRRERAEAEAALAALRRDQQAAEAALAEALRASREKSLRLEETIARLERLRQQREWLLQREERLESERQSLEASREALRGELTEAEQALAALEAEVASATEALQAVEQEDASARQLAEAQTAVAVQEREVASLRAMTEARRAERRRLARQVEQERARLAALEEEIARLEGRLAQLRADYAGARAEAERIAERLPALEAEVAEAEGAQERLEAERRRLQEALHQEERHLAAAEVELRRREDAVQALRREIEETLGIVVADLPDGLSLQRPLPMATIVSPLPTVLELPAGLEREIRDLRTQLRRLGPVNPAVEMEYTEVSERHAFLREQLADLQAASAHLKAIITELDKMMDSAFRTTFRAVATEFSRIFKRLFNGGSARLEVVRDEAGEVVGVEISARPPGKRTSGLGMLSGGERTLTAVALLFALMRVSPTPFCILDEVDAMLDEANVGRFRAYLQEMAQMTQFIVITHNRGTVEAAETIYGVSMGEDGVSQLLSLRLEDLPSATP